MENTPLNIQEIFDLWSNRKSQNTRGSYTRGVKQFFEITMNKEVKDVTEGDLNNLNMAAIEEYKEYFKKQDFKESTIINYLAVISSFFSHLEVYQIYNVNFSFIRTVLLGTKNLKNDSKTRKNMSYEDYEEFKSFLQHEGLFSKRYSCKGYQYSLLLKFMWVTGVRISAAFNIKWSDIKYESDGLGQYFHTAYITDKGEKYYKQTLSDEFFLEIEDEFYSEDKDVKIFGKLSSDGFSNLIKKFCKEHDRDFTAHSIRRGAVTYLYNLTHDLVLAQRFANHTDIQTTARYIQENPDGTAQGSYILSSDMDTNEVYEMSREELLKVISTSKELLFSVVKEAKRVRYIE